MFYDFSDIYLKRANTKLEEGSGSLANIQYNHASMQGWRKSMEDAIICLPNFTEKTHLFGVLDGHGGAEVSAVVCREYPRILIETKGFKEGDYDKSLRESFRIMDKWLVSTEGLKAVIEERFKQQWKDLVKEMKDHQKSVQKISKKKMSKFQQTIDEFQLYGTDYQAEEILTLMGQTIVEESGTTANIVLVTGDKLYCANIGDSRSVAIIKNKPVVLSFDHKPEDREERKRIQNAGGFVMEGRVCGSLSLSRAFGDFQYKGKKQIQYMVSQEPDITVQDLDQINMLLMGCDGIWEGQRDDYGEQITQKAWKLFQKHQEGGLVLRNLIDSILAKNINEQTIFGLDNMSTILIRFNKTVETNKVTHPLIQKKIKKQLKK